MVGELERPLALVAKERAGLTTPVASNRMGISQRRIRTEDTGSCFLFSGDKVITAKNSSRCFADSLTAHHA
jgi:hypothetical protein